MNQAERDDELKAERSKAKAFLRLLAGDAAMGATGRMTLKECLASLRTGMEKLERCGTYIDNLEQEDKWEKERNGGG